MQSTSIMSQCPNCFSVVEENALTCPQCGRAISSSANMEDVQVNNKQTALFVDEKKCPYCAETIKAEAVVCRFCGRDLNGPITQKTAPISSSQPISTPQTSSGAQTLGTISVICGVIGLIIFGIPLGIIALACGIPALSMGAQNGKTGIILGIIDITLAIGIIFCSSSF